jgi:hypothetical protein
MDILGIWNLESGIMSMSMLGEDRNRIEPLARVRLDASEAPWASAAASSPPYPGRLISHQALHACQPWLHQQARPHASSSAAAENDLDGDGALAPGPCPWPWPWPCQPLSEEPAFGTAQPYYYCGRSANTTFVHGQHHATRERHTYIDRRPPALDVASAGRRGGICGRHACLIPTPAQPRRRPCCCEQ